MGTVDENAPKHKIPKISMETIKIFSGEAPHSIPTHQTPSTSLPPPQNDTLSVCLHTVAN